MSTAHISKQLSRLLLFIIMTPTAQSLRVAVLGSGISGSAAARALADRGAQVTVFEAGRGIGGRTSTRVTRDGPRYQFDHGAQYIGTPKTEQFRAALEGWRRKGHAAEWTGRFVTVDGGAVRTEGGDSKKERYVGSPGMHSICRGLLHHDNIRVRLQTRANAEHDGESGGWGLVGDRTGEDCGRYDWLVASDRLSAGRQRRDLRSGNLQDFAASAGKIKNIRSLVAMVAFESPLDVDFDGAQFVGDDVAHGALGWIARDSSKPGRGRSDGQECWVLQSSPQAAADIISSIKGRYNVNMVREKAKEVLVHDFLGAIPLLTGGKDIDMPEIVHVAGHRWGAAFPDSTGEFMQMESQLIESKTFVACGDYFGTLNGRIEGAYLSGISAASQVIDCSKLF